MMMHIQKSESSSSQRIKKDIFESKEAFAAQRNIHEKKKMQSPSNPNHLEVRDINHDSEKSYRIRIQMIEKELMKSTLERENDLHNIANEHPPKIRAYLNDDQTTANIQDDAYRHDQEITQLQNQFNNLTQQQQEEASNETFQNSSEVIKGQSTVEMDHFRNTVPEDACKKEIFHPISKFKKPAKKQQQYLPLRTRTLVMVPKLNIGEIIWGQTPKKEQVSKQIHLIGEQKQMPDFAGLDQKQYHQTLSIICPQTDIIHTSNQGEQVSSSLKRNSARDILPSSNTGVVQQNSSVLMHRKFFSIQSPTNYQSQMGKQVRTPEFQESPGIKEVGEGNIQSDQCRERVNLEYEVITNEQNMQAPKIPFSNSLISNSLQLQRQAIYQPKQQLTSQREESSYKQTDKIANIADEEKYKSDIADKQKCKSIAHEKKCKSDIPDNERGKSDIPDQERGKSELFDEEKYKYDLSDEEKCKSDIAEQQKWLGLKNSDQNEIKKQEEQSKLEEPLLKKRTSLVIMYPRRIYPNLEETRRFDTENSTIQTMVNKQQQKKKFQLDFTSLQNQPKKQCFLADKQRSSGTITSRNQKIYATNYPQVMSSGRSQKVFSLGQNGFHNALILGQNYLRECEGIQSQQSLGCRLLPQKQFEPSGALQSCKPRISSAVKYQHDSDVFSQSTNIFKYIDFKHKESSLQRQTNNKKEPLTCREHIHLDQLNRQKIIVSGQKGQFDFKKNDLGKQIPFIDPSTFYYNTSNKTDRPKTSSYNLQQSHISQFTKAQISRRIKKYACKFSTVSFQFEKLQKNPQ